MDNSADKGDYLSDIVTGKWGIIKEKLQPLISSKENIWKVCFTVNQVIKQLTSTECLREVCCREPKCRWSPNKCKRISHSASPFLRQNYGVSNSIENC